MKRYSTWGLNRKSLKRTTLTTLGDARCASVGRERSVESRQQSGPYPVTIGRSAVEEDLLDVGSATDHGPEARINVLELDTFLSVADALDDAGGDVGHTLVS